MTMRILVSRCLASTALAAALAAGSAGACEIHLAQATTEVGPFDHSQHGPVVEGGALEGEAPLFDDLGTLTWPVTASPEAQRYFDQGLRLSYGFNHPEAQRAFQAAQALDPACAMCAWGEALVLGPNINMPMDPSANAPAFAAIARAQAAAGGATEKEQALIAALAERYSDAPGAERAALDRAYADAMAALAARYPDDQQIATLTAEALMDLSPWDYWQAGGTEPKGRTAELVALLEGVLVANPEHPGAIHLYIHAVEASDAPERAVPGAEKLAALMPGAGHVVHMPSHIYYRVGRYHDALASNKDAVAVDEAYIEGIGAQSLYTAMYYPHNVHFLMQAAQMSGDGPTALAAAEKLDALIPPEAARAVPPAQPVKAAVYFAHALFGEPDAVLALAGPGEGLPYIEGMWRYARGVALVAKGDLAGARAEAEAIGALKAAGDFAGLEAMAIPALPVLDIAQEMVLARIAEAEGDLDGAIGHAEAAAVLQDGLIYMEPPYWYYPLRQSLGALLLVAGRAEEAEAAFRAALDHAPNNGWALFGLAEALEAQGDTAGAAEAEALLDEAWAGDRALLDLARL